MKKKQKVIALESKNRFLIHRNISYLLERGRFFVILNTMHCVTIFEGHNSSIRALGCTKSVFHCCN